MPAKPPKERRPNARTVGNARPALLTGTSSEYLGRRPLPRVVQERSVLFVLGPPGSGKTRVAKQLALARMIGRVPPGELLVLDPPEIQNALVERIATLRWSDRLVEARGLVLDGLAWLRNRPAAVNALLELVLARSKRGRRTVLCQCDTDCSLDVLMGALEVGSAAVIGLRFPKGLRGRLRFARRACDEEGVSRTFALGTAAIEPWGYAAVTEAIRSHGKRRVTG